MTAFTPDQELTLAQIVTELSDLNRRTTRLEDLARRALPSHLVRELDAPAAPVQNVEPFTPADNTTGTATSNGNGSAPQSGSNVDYAAVAFGLTDLKRKIASQLGASAELNTEYRGMVEWFAACFAGDAAFNADTFRRNAGL